MMIPKIKGSFQRVPSLNMIGKDSDRDGAINGIDCYPHNPHKQGVIHNIKTKLKEKYDNWKQEQRETRVLENEARRQEKMAYYEEREKQRAVIGKEKAKIEARAQIQKIKEAYKPRKPTKYTPIGSGNLFAGSYGQKPKSEFSNFLGGGLFANRQPKATKKVVHKKHHAVKHRPKGNAGQKVIIIRS